jgi:hypothetical protein
MVRSVSARPTTLAAVLGSSNAMQVPDAYVDRRAVEEAFAEGLAAQTHIVVFGTPGVGKSALVRRNIDWSDLIFVECLRGQQAPDVYRSILSEVGARIRIETRLSKKRRLSATLKFFAAGTERGTENTETEVTIDLGNVGDVFRILRSRGDARHFILLNNFHVLTRGVQRRIVGDLQYVFERTDFRAIILGNWTSQAYLADLNSFLPSFATDVHVTMWSDDELIAVLQKVEKSLNVSFDTDVADELIARSVGSVRELIDNCRLLLTAVGVESTQASTKVIGDIAQLREISQQRMTRLMSRYVDMLSSYLAAELYTTEGIDVGRFLVRVVGQLVSGMGYNAGADDDDDDDDDDESSEKGTTYSYKELNSALTSVIQDYNEPSIAEQSRRRRLIEELARIIRQRGTNNVSVDLQSIVDPGRPDIVDEQYALQRSVKRLLKTQAKHSFNPPLFAYDTRGRSLIAIDPKFRVFLRMESGAVETLQRTDLIPVDRDSSSTWVLNSKWSDPIKEAAAVQRWLGQERRSGT